MLIDTMPAWPYKNPRSLLPWPSDQTSMNRQTISSDTHTSQIQYGVRGGSPRPRYGSTVWVRLALCAHSALRCSGVPRYRAMPRSSPLLPIRYAPMTLPDPTAATLRCRPRHRYSPHSSCETVNGRRRGSMVSSARTSAESDVFRRLVRTPPGKACAKTMPGLRSAYSWARWGCERSADGAREHIGAPCWCVYGAWLRG